MGITEVQSDGSFKEPSEFNEENIQTVRKTLLKIDFKEIMVIAFRMLLDDANTGDKEARQILADFMKNFDELDWKLRRIEIPRP